MPCDYGCAAILLVLRRQIPHKFNRRTLGRFKPYRLPTLPKSKSRLIYIFIVNYIYQASFWYIVSWCSVKLACIRIFSRRTPTFRSQVPWKLIRYLRIKMQFFNSEWTTVEVARLCTMQALWSYGLLSLIQLDCFSCKLRLYQTGNFHKNCMPMPLERNTYRLLIILILGGLHDDGLILIMLKVCLINFPACASCVFKHGYINLVMMSGFTFKESFHYICKYC